MSNELKERLEALSAKATQGEWDVYKYTPLKFGKLDQTRIAASMTYETQDDAGELIMSVDPDVGDFIAALINAFRSGDLITRQELEEAVTKAEANEREARSQLVDAAQWARNRLEKIADDSWHGDGRDLKRSLVGVFADFDDALKKCNSEMPEHFRARSEQKERE